MMAVLFLRVKSQKVMRYFFTDRKLKNIIYEKCTKK